MSAFDSKAEYQHLHGGQSVCNSLKQMKLYKVVLFASLFLIIVPLIIHYYLVDVSMLHTPSYSDSNPLSRLPDRHRVTRW